MSREKRGHPTPPTEVEVLRRRVQELEARLDGRSGLADLAADPEALLESIYYGIDTCLWITEVREDGEFVWIHNNPADERLTGLNLRSKAGIRFEEVMSPEDAAYNRSQCQAVLDTGKPVTFEDHFIVDGEEHWSHNTLLPIRDASGRIRRIVGAGLDITQRKRAEERAKREREKLQTILDALPAMVFIKDKENHLIGLNETFAEHTGLDSSSAVGDKPPISLSDFDICLSPEQADAYWADDKEVIATGRPKRDIVEPLLTDPSRWFQTDKMPYYDENGEIIGVIGCSIDITQRKQAEDLLRIQRDLGIAFASTSDFSEAMTLLLEAATQIEGIDCGGVYVVDAATQVSHLVAYMGVPEALAEEVCCLDKESAPGRSVLSGEALYVHPCRGVADWLDLILEEGVRTFAAVPVIHDDAVIAALCLGSHTCDEISQPARDAIDSIAVRIGPLVSRVRAEQALRESEDRNRALLSAIPDMMFRYTREGVTVDFKPAADFEPIMPPSEFLGKPLSEVLPEKVARLQMQGIEAALTTQQVQTMEYALPDGDSLRYFEGRMVPCGVDQTLLIVRDISQRVRADRALREARTNLQNLFDTLDDLILVLDDRARIIHTNPVVSKRLGYTADELKRMTVPELHPPEHREEARVILSEMLAGRASSCPIPLLTKTGEVIPTETKVARGQWGDEPALFGISRDVTERLWAEAELQRQRDFAESLVNTAQTIVLMLDPEGRIVYFNRYMERVSGYRLEEVKGQDWFATFVQPRYRRETREVFEATMKGAARNGTVGVHLTKDGRRREIEWYGKVMEDAQGRTLGLLCTGQDITDRRQAEEALRESEARYRQIVETAQEGVLETDIEGRILYLNERMAQMLGYTVDELVGRSSLDLVEPERRDELLAALQRRRAGESETLERCYTRKDGTPLWTIASLSPSRDRRGQIVGSLGMFTDITGRKQAEEFARQHQTELAHASRLATVGEMASGLAHELNQPLGAICTYAGHCKRLAEGDDRKAVLEIIDKMDSQARRASEIIRRIRGFVSKRPASRKVLDMNELLADTVALMDIETRRLGISITMDLHEGPLEALVDEIQIQQVFINLIRNASESIRESGGETRRITLTSTLPEPGVIRIGVADTGTGFDETAKERLFEPFFTTKATGMGMGLSICQSIVQAHAGRLWGTSNPEGGATFFLELLVQSQA